MPTTSTVDSDVGTAQTAPSSHLVDPLNAENAVAQINKRRRTRKPKAPRNLGQEDREAPHDDVGDAPRPPQRRRAPRPRHAAQTRDEEHVQTTGERLNVNGHNHIDGELSGRSGRSSPASTARRDRSTRPLREGPPDGHDGVASDQSKGRDAPRPGRRRQMNAKLTEPDTQETPGPSRRGHRAPKVAEAKADNLTNRLIDALRTPPYADCPICFSSIHPAQPIWCCSPSAESEILHGMFLV